MIVTGEAEWMLVVDFDELSHNLGRRLVVEQPALAGVAEQPALAGDEVEEMPLVASSSASALSSRRGRSISGGPSLDFLSRWATLALSFSSRSPSQGRH